jgi:HPt (histidine-containing phosphotransfer) domain-containing protein
MQGDREKCIQAGMDDHIPKPIQVPALVAALKKWLRPKDEISAQVNKSAETPVPSGEVPVFDRAAFLERMMQDRDLAQSIIMAFLEDVERRIGVIKRHLANGNAVGIDMEGHCIKGAAATVHAGQLRQAAEALEKAGKASNIELAAAHLSELEKQFERLRNEVICSGA